jgi:hypothetical protein
MNVDFASADEVIPRGISQSIYFRVTSPLGHADSDKYREIRWEVEKIYLRDWAGVFQIYGLLQELVTPDKRPDIRSKRNSVG